MIFSSLTGSTSLWWMIPSSESVFYRGKCCHFQCLTGSSVTFCVWRAASLPCAGQSPSQRLPLHSHIPSSSCQSHPQVAMLDLFLRTVLHTVARGWGTVIFSLLSFPIPCITSCLFTPYAIRGIPVLKSLLVCWHLCLIFHHLQISWRDRFPSQGAIEFWEYARIRFCWILYPMLSVAATGLTLTGLKGGANQHSVLNTFNTPQIYSRSLNTLSTATKKWEHNFSSFSFFRHEAGRPRPHWQGLWAQQQGKMITAGIPEWILAICYKEEYTVRRQKGAFAQL